MGQWPMSKSFVCKNQEFDGPLGILMDHLEKKRWAKDTFISTLQQNEHHILIAYNIWDPAKNGIRITLSLVVFFIKCFGPITELSLIYMLMCSRKVSLFIDNYSPVWPLFIIKMSRGMRFPTMYMCDQERLRPACAYAQSDQSLCQSLEYFMTVKLLTKHHLEFLSLKDSCTGSSQSTPVKCHIVGNHMSRLKCL